MTRDALRTVSAVVVLAAVAEAQTVTPGLQGDYWGPNLAAIPAAPGVPAGNPATTRTDPVVDFADATFPGAYSNADNFVVRWTGFVRGPVTGPVTFYTNTDDGVELVVNNVAPALISNWTDHGATDNQGDFSMTQGVWVPLRLTFYEKGGGAVMRLTWSYAGQARVTIPSSAMSATTPPGPTGPVLSIATPQNRTPVINLNWTAVPNASDYRLLRSSQSGTETPYQTLTGTSYADTGVTFGATYFYLVRATVGPTTSGNSNEVSGSPQPVPERTVGDDNDHMCGVSRAAPAGEGILLWALAAAGLLAAVRRR